MHLPALFTLRLLLAIAVSCLVLNDVARLVCPQVQEVVMKSIEKQNQDGNNPVSTLFEEEVKHKSSYEHFCFTSLMHIDDLNAAINHRITDDNVRHLAFLAIFTPPPDLAASLSNC